MDDVDAVQAQIGRNMLVSGDWVTAHLNGVAYLEKAPLIYWMMAVSYKIFGVHDWASRLPLALSCVLLCWVIARFGCWAFGPDAGTYSGLALATCVGLFLFTRIQIPDAQVTLTIACAIWACLRLLEPECPRPRLWVVMLGASLGLGLLLKGLIAIVFPILTVLAFMAVTRQLFSLDAWKKLRLGWVAVIMIAIAAPWHVLATLRNPPYFASTMHSGPGQYHGFFWFYFFNEHLLRFLNLRYPRDYNTVPRLLFWTLNLVWIFPWTVYLPAAARLEYNRTSREGRARLMAVCWIAVVMLFFTFSTTQEYYSMPIYPALALLIGSALASGSRWLRPATLALSGIMLLLGTGLGIVLWKVWALPAPGEISQALTQNPAMYTLSLGHMTDLTLRAFAYLKFPLALAVAVMALLGIGLLLFRGNTKRAALVAAVGMIIFFQAARIALVRFDPYLGSYPLAQALLAAPPGELIEADTYYAFSSVFFYTGRTALILDGRYNNLEYGSYAPGAPQVFIDDMQFASLWSRPQRYYLLVYGEDVPRLERLVGREKLMVVAENAGNFLLTNQPLSGLDQRRNSQAP